jgi:PIN domain nuclease of toxin-antitoxin system
VLPWRHFEPFARILIARAVAETPPVITADRDRRRDAVEFIR